MRIHGFCSYQDCPTESAPGAREKYTMRVPNEKQVNTIRVEGEFPAGLQIYDFEFKPGWKIDFKKDDNGKIVGATWTGKVQPFEFVEFGMLGINLKKKQTWSGSSCNITRTVRRKSSPDPWDHFDPHRLQFSRSPKPLPPDLSSCILGITRI